MSKVKSKTSDLAIEFKDDPMMQELHAIRRKTRRETKGLSDREFVQYYRERARKFIGKA